MEIMGTLSVGRMNRVGMRRSMDVSEWSRAQRMTSEGVVTMMHHWIVGLNTPEEKKRMVFIVSD
jgi:hypothetical protein